MMNTDLKPPGWAKRILKWFVPGQLLESISGDLEEQFFENIKKGNGRAKFLYFLSVIKFFRPGILVRRRKSPLNKSINHLGLLPNYLLVSVRFARRNLLYSTINIGALSVGLAFCLLAYTFVVSELSYDRFHSNYERIYRVGVGLNFVEPQTFEGSPFLLAEEIKDNIPEVETASHIVFLNDIQVVHNDKNWQTNVSMSTPSFFEMFNFPLANNRNYTPRPNKIAISQKLSNQYFGAVNPVGNVLVLKRGEVEIPFEIDEILESIPENSSIQFDIIISDQHFDDFYGEGSSQNWRAFKSPVVTFVKTRSGYMVNQLRENLNALAVATGLEEIMRSHDMEEKLPVLPLTAFHFENNASMLQLQPPANKMLVFLFIGVSIIILIIACFNFINFSLSFLAQRTKEAGIRKIMGANSGSIFTQSLFDTFLFITIGILVSTVIAYLLLPYFNQILEKDLSIHLLDPRIALGILGMLMSCVIITGTYPAWMHSSFTKGRRFLSEVIKNPMGVKRLSNFLLTFQFMATMVLLSSWLIIFSQVNGLKDFELGYNPKQVLYQEFDIKDALSDSEVDQLRNELFSIPSVTGVTSSRGAIYGETPGSMWRLSFNDETINVAALKVDYDFINLMEISLLEGRNFSRDNQADGRGSVLVNQKFLEQFNCSEYVGITPPIFGENGPKIIGVVGDYHFQSLRKEVEPVILNLRPDSNNSAIFIKLDSDDHTAIIEIERATKKIFSNKIIGFQYLEDYIAGQYKDESNLKTAIQYSSIIAFLISIGGVMGLLSFTLKQNMKNIGIRKVLGAELSQLFRVYAGKYLLFICGAALIAFFLSFQFFTLWIDNYFVKVEFQPAFMAIPFFIVAGTTLVITLLQVWSGTSKNITEVLSNDN